MNRPAGAPARKPDVIIRHSKERKSKCSLQPLVGRDDLLFLTAQPGFQFDATGFVLLRVGAPVLSPDDEVFPLLILDSTWRLLPQLEASVTGTPVCRSLPESLKTAYPRVSKTHLDPARGLASVEALYTARQMQGRPVEGLLDHYHWRDDFLSQFQL